MNYAEAVEHIKSVAPDLLIDPQSGNHVDVRKAKDGKIFSITLPDASHLFTGYEAIKEAETAFLNDCVAAAKKTLG